MAKELIINASLPEVRIALMEEGQIQELLIERASEKGIVGNIYKGRVTRVLPGMQAAFVDVGLDKAAFLYVDDIYVHPKVMGDEVDHSDEDHEEEHHHAPQPRIPTPGGGGGIIRPREQKPETEILAEGSEEAEGIDTSEIALHAADVAEKELTEDEVAKEFHQAAIDEAAAFEDEAEDFSESEESSDEDNNEDESGDESGDESEEDSDADDLEDDSEDDADDELTEEASSASDDSSEESTEESTVEASSEASSEAKEDGTPASLEGIIQEGSSARPKRFRRGKNRRGGKRGEPVNKFPASSDGVVDPNLMPETLNESLADRGNVESDRSSMNDEPAKRGFQTKSTGQRPEFKEPRNRDRRIKSKSSRPRAPANISDLLKEGQEVIVQVAKDPIATKGARLTCHVSLPGRHLVCMPTIDHVGVSRRIERDDERRSLRNFVERNRPKKMGFIVRTASGGKDPESWIKQDIDYLSKLWKEIRTRADDVSAPAVVYEDLNSVLRAIRDWVNEDISKIIVDSRYHYNELMQFAERFMPQLTEIIELYQGDIPIFDAYGISSELHRSLERKVWLKSGGSIVIDQAEALVAIDVNTGRFVGKKSLEDTIFKTNLEAAEEIAHQLRLRNCGGIIIVDFIDMEREENKMRVYRALDEALKKDRARPTIQKISELGLVEMTRKRTRDTIIRTLCEPCTHCEGKGFTKSVRTVAYEILREMERLGVDREAKKILVSAHEQVIDILAIDFREVVDSLERRYNKQVFLQAIMDFHAEQFEVVTDRMQGKKQTADIARQLRIERDRAERKEKTEKRQRDDETRPAPQRIFAKPVPNPDYDDHVGGSDDSVAPAPKPSGVIIPRGSFAPAKISAPNPDQIGNAGPIPNSGPQPIQQPSHQPTGMEDEDQLAYLRAQAAQDAALASFGQGGGGNVSPSVQNQGNGRNNPRNQNPRNNNRGGQGGGQGGGRNNSNRGGQGGGQGAGRNNRFQNNRNGQGGRNAGPNANPGNSGGIIGGGVIRPQPSPSEQIAAAAPAVYEAPQEIQVPDYEVLIKNDGDSSDNT